MTCAIPASQLADVVAAVQQHATADSTDAKYAAEDATRF
jgi:hypothetical protein